jgi:hypothetical protein
MFNLELFLLNYVTRRVNNSLNDEQAKRFVSFVSQCEDLHSSKSSNSIGSLLVYFIRELYEYIKRLVKVDMKCLHEYRYLGEELKHFQKIK